MSKPLISDGIRQIILEFVDSTVRPEATESVWLTGSRARGNARADSDWDVVVFNRNALKAPEDLFKSNYISAFKIDGGVIELVIAHPDHREDARQYMTECRRSGVQLR